MRRRTTIAVALVVAIVLVAGCGDEEGSGNDGPGSTSTTTPGSVVTGPDPTTRRPGAPDDPELVRLLFTADDWGEGFEDVPDDEGGDTYEQCDGVVLRIDWSAEADRTFRRGSVNVSSAVARLTEDWVGPAMAEVQSVFGRCDRTLATLRPLELGDEALRLSFRDGSGVDAFEVDAVYIRIGDLFGIVFLSSPVGRDRGVDLEALARTLERTMAAA